MAAMIDNSTILRLDSQMGRLAQGVSADVIAFDGDPFGAPELRAVPGWISLVVQGGVMRTNSFTRPMADQVPQAFEGANG